MYIHPCPRSSDDILTDERLQAMQKALKNLQQYIPPDIRGTNRRSALRKEIRRSSIRVDVPQVVQDLQDKREVLFPNRSNTQNVSCAATTQNNDHYSSIVTPSQTNILANCYMLVVNCERQEFLNKIRLRLLYVAFYRVKQNIQPGSQYEYSDAANYIAKAISHAGSVNDSFDTIHLNVRTWIGYGERYSLLANDLGGLGVLYILPENGGETL